MEWITLIALHDFQIVIIFLEKLLRQGDHSCPKKKIRRGQAQLEVQKQVIKLNAAEFMTNFGGLLCSNEEL